MFRPETRRSAYRLERGFYSPRKRHTHPKHGLISPPRRRRGAHSSGPSTSRLPPKLLATFCASVIGLSRRWVAHMELRILRVCCSARHQTQKQLREKHSRGCVTGPKLVGRVGRTPISVADSVRESHLPMRGYCAYLGFRMDLHHVQCRIARHMHLYVFQGCELRG